MKPSLASSMTKAASKQTYYTFRFLVDRPLVPDAYRAYAYFRWIDDRVDQIGLEDAGRIAFIDRQETLMEGFYQGSRPDDLTVEEHMLADLIMDKPEVDSGLDAYIRNMMAVIDFDARRRGRIISQLELSWYTRTLAISVTEALLYFIGHGRPSPHHGGRYQAVTGAHIAHLLRDTLEDVQAGYYNIPREYLAAKGIGPQDVESDAYRGWVQERTNQARVCFRMGKEYLAQLDNLRARIAGFAYIARFELVLEGIEMQGYRLGTQNSQDWSLGKGMKLSSAVLSQAIFPR